MKEKRDGTNTQSGPPETDQSKYLTAGRAVIFGADAQGSDESEGGGLQSIGAHDPGAATLGNDIALNCVTFDSPGFDVIEQWRVIGRDDGLRKADRVVGSLVSVEVIDASCISIHGDAGRGYGDGLVIHGVQNNRLNLTLDYQHEICQCIRCQPHGHSGYGQLGDFQRVGFEFASLLFNISKNTGLFTPKRVTSVDLSVRGFRSGIPYGGLGYG